MPAYASAPHTAACPNYQCLIQYRGPGSRPGTRASFTAGFAAYAIMAGRPSHRATALTLGPLFNVVLFALAGSESFDKEGRVHASCLEFDTHLDKPA